MLAAVKGRIQGNVVLLMMIYKSMMAQMLL